MVRDNLYITVPSVFRCPISLEVMKSPVSLCTGMTYDRSSIQRWLDGGNNTCPATMQVLQTKDFVPNRTLQRLIQIWSSSGQPPGAISRDHIVAILKLVGDSTSPSDALSAIRAFASESDQNREFLAGLDGLLPFLADVLGSGDASIAEVVVGILDSVLGRVHKREEMAMLVTEKCLSSLTDVLLRGKETRTRAGSARVIESISLIYEPRRSPATDQGVLRALLSSIVEENKVDVVAACVSCLTSLASHCNRVKAELVRLKVLPLLLDLLVGTSGRNVELVKKTMELMGVLSSSKEGRDGLCGEERCLEVVLDKAMKVSPPATDHAVTVLWAICCMARSAEARQTLVKNNGVAKVLLLLQSNCSPESRRKLLQLLRLFRATSSSSDRLLTSYDTNTIHVMPF